MARNLISPGMKRARKAMFNATRAANTNRQRRTGKGWRLTHDSLTPKVSPRRRSWKGPTRYVPRCSGRHCWNALSDGRHIGLCDGCREALWRFGWLAPLEITAEVSR